MQMTTKKIPYHSFSFRCTLHPDAHHLTANPHSDDLKAALPEKLSKLKAYAEHYDKTSQPIQGTLAETYLQRQGIETQTLSAVRFHDSVYSSESKQTHPAMIATYTDKEKNTQAIEITYLKENGERAELDIDQRILGNKSKHLVEIQDCNPHYPSVIIEGTEQALSISQKIKPDYSIYSIDNLNHLKSVDSQILNNHHVIIVDNKTLHKDVLDDIIHTLNEKGIQVDIIQEDKINTLISNIEKSDELNTDVIKNHNDDKDTLNVHDDTSLSINDKEISVEKERDYDIESTSTPSHNKERDINIDEFSL